MNPGPEDQVLSIGIDISAFKKTNFTPECAIFQGGLAIHKKEEVRVHADQFEYSQPNV